MGGRISRHQSIPSTVTLPSLFCTCHALLLLSTEKRAIGPSRGTKFQIIKQTRSVRELVLLSKPKPAGLQHNRQGMRKARTCQESCGARLASHVPNCMNAWLGSVSTDGSTERPRHDRESQSLSARVAVAVSRESSQAAAGRGQGRQRGDGQTTRWW